MKRMIFAAMVAGLCGGAASAGEYTWTKGPIWAVGRGTSALTDEPKIVVIGSATSVSGECFGSQVVELGVTCLEGETSVVLNVPRCLFRTAEGYPSHQVEWRVDTAPAGTVGMDVGMVPADALAMPEFGGSIAEIKRLIPAKRLVVRAETIYHGRITAVFDLTGFAKAIAPVREACGW